MQLISCPNLSKINENYQNNVLTVATKSINDFNNVHCYCAFADLLSPRPSKLGQSYLKIKV
jgi:hypothetical protein